MKRIALTIALVLSLGLGSASAEENSVNGTNSSVRTIKSPRFARPLVEKWIEEYAKTEPGVEFQIVKGSGNQDNIDLNVTISDNQDNNEKLFGHIIYFGETAVLPVTARSSEAARLLEGIHNRKILDYYEDIDPIFHSLQEFRNNLYLLYIQNHLTYHLLPYQQFF